MERRGLARNESVPPAAGTGPFDLTMCKWVPAADIVAGPGFQPLYKLHGSTNWQSEACEPFLIMGNGKTGAIRRFPVLQAYHDQFAARLNATHWRQSMDFHFR
jgi:hypothetical protein